MGIVTVAKRFSLLFVSLLITSGLFRSVRHGQSVTQAQPSDAAPIFEITPDLSKISFYVKASVSLKGTFDNWNATLAFTSPDASTGVLDIKIQADSVNTGSKSKDKRLKGDECFNVGKYPYITFHSTKITQTSPNTFDVAGTFTVRGISKPQTLTFIVDRDAQGATGEIKGTLVFDRRDFELSGNIPFVKIANHVEVTMALKATRVGPALVLRAG